MSAIKLYKINIEEERLAKLKLKLQQTDFPDELEDALWAYGAPLKDIKELATFWIEKFDWREVEKKLNHLPHFQTPITVEGFGSLDVHFIHQKSDVNNAIPLLFVHGWPGSFIEVTKLLPLLRGDKGRQAFHVVAPSLPNYGFSSRVTKKGFGLGQHAEVLHKVMPALGYNRYDWGVAITRIIGSKYPQHCKACHINLIPAVEPAWTAEHPKPEYTKREKAALAELEILRTEGTGYFSIQSTKPATLAFLLHDSPVGLLAWIYEKLHAWSDSYPWTPDEVLTWVSIYYFSTAGPAASTYTYFAAAHDPKYNFSSFSAYMDVPLGLAAFPRELANAPESWWSSLGPILSKKTFQKGGHFAAWERPDDIAGHFCEMFGPGGPAEHVLMEDVPF
ncbi:hypothetical protein EG329_012886 [Mollisiaceae sp. DMI_Dod_QoI]|nr:hypothetical protein EG329_012886 [Helotiales sp. DMI_Dod_QoI]